MSKKRKVRVEFRKNRSKPARDQNWTRRFHAHGDAEEDAAQRQQVRAKGDLSRKRTIITEGVSAASDEASAADLLAVDLTACRMGRVVRVHGTQNVYVQDEDGREVLCAVRRLLRSLVIDEGNVVAVGDRVWFRVTPTGEGFIEKVEPRYGLLTRASRGKEQVLVANVDQVVIVASLAEPALKPHLIDRYLISATQGRIEPIICLNKADLIDPMMVQPLVGLYSQLGYRIVMTSTRTGQGVEILRSWTKQGATAFCGQSGVGKSSLLNAIQPGLDLRVSEVSELNQKGRHTTTTAQLLHLDQGGWVVDTPGIRQFGLWKIIPQELDGAFPEFRPHVARCRFPGCSHTHEANCGVKQALEKGWIASQRYESYLDLFHGGEEEE